nr:kinesin-like protein KIF12 isoform X1 [Procambarus clarkii]XP_045584393.1 kinesin-like protein KIF12 isoform X1 [Procambarus clarkii]XP_045584394.1 kinesin-like protein KIF12 isoform X1 [Procambarus clarkii]
MVERRVGRRGDSPGSRESLMSGGSGTSEGSSLNGSRGFTGHSTLPSPSEGLGSTVSSLDQTMTRSLGSRGSLCDEAADDCDNINVVVRCRPLNEKEKLRGDESNVTFPGEGQAWVNMDGVNGQATQKPKVFSYNVVFEPEATQEDVLEHSGVKRVLDMAIDGFSCTVFCYGQTGSGKTHTLTGPPHLYYMPTTSRTRASKTSRKPNFFSFDKGPDMFSESHGLIFRSFVYLFNQLQSRDDQEFTLTASYLEIYNEKVIDLLNMGTNNKPLQVRWSKKKRGFFVENLFEIECAELDDLLAVLEEGLRNRAVASHNMNEYSSRSHTILSVNITSEQKADDGVYVTRNGKINFVDLAGSEMTKKTNSEGKTLEEANNINKSLMVLGTCIAALSDSRKRDSHIPYRDSKLTKLLADSLAGNGVTLMIACVSPAKSNISETLNTLRYASRAKRIRTKPIIVMDPKEKVIMSLQREVSLLREENAHLKMLIDLGENGLPREGDHAGVRGGGGALPSLSTTGANIPGPVSDAVTQPMSRQGSFRIDNEKLENLDNRELIRLVQHYMAEHENVRMENKELQEIATSLVRDQELVCKENERLLRQLEVVNSGPSSEPNEDREDLFTADSGGGQPPPGEEDLAGTTQPFSRGSTKSSKTASFRSRSLPSSSSSDVWINPLNDTSAKESGSAPSSRGRESTSQSSQRSNRLPDSINKELEKRRIGKSMTDLSASGGGGGGNSGGKQAISDGKTDTGVILTRRAPMKSKNLSPAGVVAGKSGGRGNTRSKSVPRLKGGRRGDIPRGPAARGTDRTPPADPSYPGSSLPSEASTASLNSAGNQPPMSA